MADKRRLVFSIMQFLNKEIASEHMSEDGKESLEVASQCLQAAFGFSSEDAHLEVSKPLEAIFREATHSEPMRKKAPPTEAEKEEAEKLKSEGNDLMRLEQFEAAIEKYSRAIELDSSNQVFYCNRAAALSKLNQHYAAIEDCKRAIDMDPKYDKAYGRMGVAYSSVERHREAIDCFKKAIEIDPDNECCRNNLKLAEERLQTIGRSGQANDGTPVGSGLDFGSLLNNPAMMNIASTLLSDPNMVNLMGQIMSAQMASGGTGSGSVPGLNNIQDFLQAGQRMAEQMQQSNPEMVEQLRRQLGGGGGGSGGGADGGGSGPNHQPTGDSSQG